MTETNKDIEGIIREKLSIYTKGIRIDIKEPENYCDFNPTIEFIMQAIDKHYKDILDKKDKDCKSIQRFHVGLLRKNKQEHNESAKKILSKISVSFCLKNSPQEIVDKFTSFVLNEKW